MWTRWACARFRWWRNLERAEEAWHCRLTWTRYRVVVYVIMYMLAGLAMRKDAVSGG